VLLQRSMGSDSVIIRCVGAEDTEQRRFALLEARTDNGSAKRGSCRRAYASAFGSRPLLFASECQLVGDPDAESPSEAAPDHRSPTCSAIAISSSEATLPDRISSDHPAARAIA
jgi:hypothetical protein